MHVPPNLLPIIEDKFPNAKNYVEDWMLVKKGQANFFGSEHVHKLCSRDDASKLAILLSSREDRPKRTKKYMDWISKTPIYGVSINSELVSYAGSFLQLPQVWMKYGKTVRSLIPYIHSPQLENHMKELQQKKKLNFY